MTVARMEGPSSLAAPGSRKILLIGYLLHPIHKLAVECLLDGDVSHACGGRCAVPVAMIRRTPDDIARADLRDRASFTLRPAAAGGDNERLAERVRMPGGARAGLECDAGACYASRRGGREQWVDADI